jgi:hypothetical protein
MFIRLLPVQKFFFERGDTLKIFTSIISFEKFYSNEIKVDNLLMFVDIYLIVNLYIVCYALVYEPGETSFMQDGRMG